MAAGQIRVLGALHLHDGGGRISVGSDASARLLASLVAAGGGFVSGHDLSERLWPDDVPGSRLRMTVSRLRGRLAEVGLEAALVTMPGGYRLDASGESVDATVFADLVEDARAVAVGAPDRAVALLEEGLRLWTGPAFEGMESEPWLAGSVERLREQRLDAEDLLADLHLRSGRAAAVLARLTSAVEEEPLREQRWVHLVSALRATSRRSDALRAIDRARRVLGSTVGLGLGAELLALEQDLLSGTATRSTSAPWRAAPELVGRDAELTHLRRLLRSTRIVVVTGLGGVGKSALASAFASEMEASDVAVLRTAVDAIASPSELRAQFAAAVGLQGTDDPAGFLDAVARRAPREGLWVIDGAEADPVAVAEVVALVSQRSPALRFVITSRLSLPLSDAAPLPLDPLEVGTVDAPGPAMRVLSDRAGVLLDRAPPADREAIARLCTRAGGLPLALELLAAASARGGLHALAAHGADHAPGLEESVGWALDAMPPDCRGLLVHAAHLATDLGPHLAAALAACDESELLALVGPAVQARLCSTVPGPGGGHRYQLPDAVRSAIRSLARAPEQDLVIHRCLCQLGRDVGPLHGPADAAALDRLDAELDNVRHWLGRLLGRPEGLELAMATARGWKELGLGGEGADALQEQAAAGDHPPPLAAAARIAAASVRGFLDLGPEDLGWLEADVATVDEADDAISWLHGSVLLTLVCGWTGDVMRGHELLLGPVAQARLDEVGEPWFRTQRQSVLAIGPMAMGAHHQARWYLEGVLEQYLEQGDPSSALDTALLRISIARIAEDWDALARDLEAVDPLVHQGVARGAAAALRAEAAYVLRARGDAAAPASMATAIAALERAGGLRLAASHRPALASWLDADGRPDDAVTQLQVAMPTLLRFQRRGAALALAHLSELVDADLGAQLVGALRRVDASAREAIVLPAPLLARLEAAVTDARERAPEGVEAGARLDDDELLDLVAGLRARP